MLSYYPHCRFLIHDDVIKWKHFPRYWPFVREIHRYPVNSPYKGQWRGAVMFSLSCVWIIGWENNREAVDMRWYRAHYDAFVMHLIATIAIYNTLTPSWHISLKRDIISLNADIGPTISSRLPKMISGVSVPKKVNDTINLQCATLSLMQNKRTHNFIAVVSYAEYWRFWGISCDNMPIHRKISQNDFDIFIGVSI